MMPPSPSPLPLAIRLFGPFEVCLHGEPLLRLHTRKSQWVLALLALRSGQAVERSWLAGLVWPDQPPSKAPGALRRSLTDLRRTLGSEAWRIQSPGRPILRLDLAGAFADVLAFDAAIGRGDPMSLRSAIALYRGPLLEGCIEPWALQERLFRAQAYLAALEKLAEHALTSRDHAAAESYLRTATTTDPLRDSAHRQLMALLAADGNYAAALLVYRELRVRLYEELNAEPDPETVALFHQIREEAARRSGAASNGRLIRSCAASEADPGSRPQEQPRHNLPQPVTSFVGREGEIAAIHRFLQAASGDRPDSAGASVPAIVSRLSPLCRLLTVTGAGGCGKSRLALEAVRALLPGLNDGAWLVEMASVAEGDLVPQAVATALGVPERPGERLTETLVAVLRAKRLILLLDNCEHLLSACATLADVLLRQCPGIRILATSREALGILGETAYPIVPLSLSDIGHGRCFRADAPTPPVSTSGSPITAFTRSDAGRLFVDRAIAAQPSFVLTAENADTVAEICQRLDGIPLALELAAARLRTMPVERLAARLNDCFRLLTHGNRAALPRHRTLGAMLAWSYDLLTEPERRLLRRLSTFAGSWTMEAAEGVGAGDGMEQEDVLDLLSQLVEKSLVAYVEQEGEARYRLLETVRQYARDRLLETGEAPEARRRHRDWFLALAERGGPQLFGAEQTGWLDRLEREHDNLRTAFEWSLECGEVAPALRLAAAVWRFWLIRGHVSEGRERLAAVMSRAGAAEPARERARALDGAGVLAIRAGDLEAARSHYEEMLAIGHRRSDKQILAVALNGLGHVDLFLERPEQASHLFSEASALAQEAGDRWEYAFSLHCLGLLAHWRGENNAASSLYEKSLAIRRELGDRKSIGTTLSLLANVVAQQADYGRARSLGEEAVSIARELRSEGTASALGSLADVARSKGDHARARSLWEEALATAREWSDPWHITWSTRGLETVLLEQGEYEAVCSLYRERLALMGAVGDRSDIADCLERLARVAAQQRQSDRAAKLFGAAEAARETVGVPREPEEHALSEGSIEAVRSDLSEEAFNVAWARGRAMPLEEAVQYALTAGTTTAS
jgi:predicted ATPase/DNA-binding SARP family transcriptional activator/Tfp pilus assembly protein PilF